MTAGLRDNPSRLIITLSPQWGKPDPKHSTARHGQPTALLINERQPPWLLSFVCFERRVGNIPSKCSRFCTIVGVQRPWEWVGMWVWSEGMLGRNLKIILLLQHNIAAISVPSDILAYYHIWWMGREIFPTTDPDKDLNFFWSFVLIFFRFPVRCICVWWSQYSREMAELQGDKVRQRQERKSSREKMTERCRSSEAEAVAFLKDEH